MSNEVEFSDLSYEDRVVMVNERIGNHPDRITHPAELLDLYGQKIYLVVSPFGKVQEIGNCFLLEWPVGIVIEHRGESVQKNCPLEFDNDQKYICFSYDNPEHGISLKDFNVVPNSYNNHAAFSSEDAALAYILYRKVQYPQDSSIAELDGDYDHWITIEDIERLKKSEESSN